MDASRGQTDRVGVMTRFRSTLLALALVIVTPAWASADVTAFWGISRTSDTRSTRGFSAGINLLVVGFEFEYANTPEDLIGPSASLTTGMINGLVQTPTPGVQFYLTAGGGFHRQRLDDDSVTHFGTNVGGGAKIGLVGPLRLRLDYRIFSLRGNAFHVTPQRFYAGVNLSF